MNKKLLLIVGAVLLAFCIVISVFIGIFLISQKDSIENQKDDTHQTDVEEEEDEVNKDYSIQSITIKNNYSTYSVDITYPQIENLENEETQNKINNEIKSFVDESILETSLLEYDPTFSLNSIFYNFTTENKTERLLSILIKGSSYSGGAHPFPLIKTFNFNIETGEDVSLINSLQTAGSINLLSTLSETKLVEIYGTDLESSIELGTTPEINNFKNFNLTESGLKITFDAYQVAPFALGTPEIKINYSELEEVLKSEILSLI